MKQLGDILLQDGLVTEDQLFAAFREHKEQGKALGRVLVDQGVLTESQLVAALAQQIGLEFVDLGDYPVDGSIIARVSGAICRKHSRAAPADRRRGQAAAGDGRPGQRLRDRRHPLDHRHSEVRPVVATRADVIGAIDRYFRADSELDDLTAVMDGDDEDEDLSNLKEVVEDAPIVKFVNLLITQAIQDRASDIHLEPNEHALVVRYRIDGVLHEVMKSPKNIQSGVISRLKIMSDINIAERRVPQDGRLSVNHQGKKIDLRVATLPTVWGEKVVMRILDNSNAQMALSDLGFSEFNSRRLRPELLQAVRDDPGDRTDRFGQVDDAVRDAQPDRPSRGQRHHRRGPGGVPASRHQPGADQRQGGPDLRRGPAVDPAL